MDLNTRKEEFSYAYIGAIAAVAGLVIVPSKRGMDNAGIDLSVEVPGELENQAFPTVRLQVKCTADDTIINNTSVRFPLPVRNYNRLRKANSATPLLLVVMLVPDNLETWLEVKATLPLPEVLTQLRRCAYWRSLKGMPETANAHIQTVEIPRTNLLTPESLLELMSKVAKGEDL
ncbi:MAG: DUF4365 domain-containing protein [Leptolyngbyaceae cyanobacterium bins.349]|nr:DUF4365 domain-containing protein [Leptolyngbyaceae cyanobacterium bins.349]